ncbi:MAG TPA: hypothetical protein VIN67_05685 [Desulfobaccales bacterium]
MLEDSKTELYRLIEALPESEALIAKKFMEFLISVSGDPLLNAFLKAPEDDELLAAQDLKDLKIAEKALAEGKVKEWGEVKKDLGL